MYRTLVATTVAFLIGLSPVAAQAQAPAQLPMQGYLTDAEGAPVDGARSMVFGIFANETGGTALFTETQSVMVDSGWFTAYVGDVDTLDLTQFRDNSVLYMSVTVDGEELLPRAQLASVPYAGYAQYAGDATSVGGLSATDLSAPPAWADITGVPGDLADGDDDTDTTYSAGSGLMLGGTTFSVNTASVQSRVTGTCPPGQSIRSIAANGTVTCEPDDAGSTYTTGFGLSLAGTTLSVNTTDVQRRVTGTCGPGSSIRSISATGTVVCEPDADTTYTAGAGLSLTGTTMSWDGRSAGDTSFSTTALTTSCGAYANAAVTITVPSSGRIIVDGMVTVLIDHTTGSTTNGHVSIGTTTTDCAGGSEQGSFAFPSSFPSGSGIEWTVPVHRAFPVFSAGTYTYYVTGRLVLGGAGSDFWYSNIDAIFVPN